MRATRLLPVLLVCLISAACAKESGPIDPGPSWPQYTWWQDVQPIVAAKCQLCHGAPPLFGAPRPYVTYADTQVRDPNGTAVHVLMAGRVNAEMLRMPPAGQPQLTIEEREIIKIWSLIGAPEGTPPGTEPDAGVAAGDDAAAATHDDATTTEEADGGTTVNDDATAAESDGGTTQPGEDASTTPAPDAASSDGGPTLRALDFLAHEPNGTGAYSIPSGNTSYICWAFEIPPTTATEEHAIRFEPVIDNAFFIHHMLLFRNTGNAASNNPFDCESWPLDWDLVAGWAPGRGADDIPPGAGVTVRPGDQFVLQSHYNGVHVPTETDQSGIRVVLTDAPGLVSAGMVWSGVIFLSSINGSNVQRQGTCTINTPITMFSIFPHMHQVGRRITLEVRRQGQGAWNMLVDIDPWSFADQPNVSVPPAEQLLSPGDQLRTTCWWNTNGQSVSYGEASDDEMCFNFVYHYPLMSNQYACVDTAF